MAADYFHPRRRYSDLPRKKRAQLGVRLASLWRRGDPDLQRAVRKLARDLGFRTLRRYLHTKSRGRRFCDPLLEEFMHRETRGVRRPRYAQSIELRCLPPDWWPNYRRCSWWRRTAAVLPRR